MAQGNRRLPLRERHGMVPTREMTLEVGVSTHLAHALWDWCRRRGLQVTKADSDPKQPQLSVRAHRMCLSLDVAVGDHLSDLSDLVFLEPDVLLDMADWILHEDYKDSKSYIASLSVLVDSLSRLRDDNPIDDLKSLFLDARSAWRVAEPPDHLELRVTVELEEEFKAATIADDETSEHLTDAWGAAWRRSNPSAKEAYDAAVKALEATLAPIVIPNEAEPTLGKILGEIRAKHTRGRWGTRLRGQETVDALQGLLDELWQTHSRHALMPPNNLEQAQDAVTIAVAIVSLVRRGFLTRVDDSNPQTTDPPAPPRADPPPTPTATSGSPDGRP